jgi:hypothetical protein
LNLKTSLPNPPFKGRSGIVLYNMLLPQDMGIKKTSRKGEGKTYLLLSIPLPKSRVYSLGLS